MQVIAVCSRTYNLPLGKSTAQNGFVNVTLEEDHVDGDVYTTDGPLQSGTQSLRRISNKSRVRPFITHALHYPSLRVALVPSSVFK